MPFDPKRTSITLLLWLARRSAEDGYDPWWRGNYGLTPRTVALMDKAYREATEDVANSTRMKFKSYGS